MPIIMTFDASDFALGPEDEEAEGRLANGAARQDVAVTAATPPATGAIAPQVAPRAISVVRESEALSPRLKEQGAAALHGGAHLSPKALSRATERPLLHDEPSRTVGSESLRELRATVARHEQLIEAQRRAIIGLEGIVSRLVAHDEANGGAGHQGAAAHARGSTAAFVQATQQPSGAVAKPDASPRKPAASQPRAPAASSGRGLGGGSALGGSALPYEKRLSCVTQQSVESAVALGRASPPRRLSEDAAHNVVRYSVRGRHVSTYGPTHPSGAVDAALAGQPPELAPSLDYVYGYRAHVPGLNVNNPLVVVSPDVVVYAAGRLCVVLDSATNSQAFYGRHEEDVLCVAAAPPAPDGTIYLASGELGRRPGIHIWALAGCEPIAVLSDAQHERGIGLLAFSPDGAWLASVGLDNHRTLVIWDWARQAPLASIKAHNEPLFAIGFNPTDSGVLSIVGARAYKLFKLEQPPPDKHPATHVASISAPPLLISKRTGVFGKLGCGAGGQPQTLLCLAYRSDGLAATGCASGDVLIWRGQEVEAKLRGAHEAPVYSVAMMADGHMVTGDRHGLLALWDSSHAHVLSRALDDRQPEGCELPAIRCLAPLGARAAQLEGASGYVEADFGAASWSVLIGCSDGSIREIALSSGVAQVWMQAHGGGGAVTGLATDPTDAARFASCSTDRTVRVWSAEQRWPISQCTLSEETCSVDWGPRGDVLAVGLLNGSVLVLKADSLEPHASVKRRNEGILEVKWSPSGKFLAAACKDGSIDILDGDDLGLVGSCKGHSAPVVHIDWAADGSKLQSNSTDHELFCWSMPLGGHPISLPICRDTEWATWTCTVGWPVRGIWDAESAEILELARSSDELGVVATVDESGRVRLLRWPCVREGAGAVLALGHSNHVVRVRFIKDDAVLLTAGGHDCCVMQWRIV